MNRQFKPENMYCDTSKKELIEFNKFLADDIKIENCPFCNYQDLNLVKGTPHEYGNSYFFACNSCDATSGMAATAQLACILWNNRGGSLNNAINAINEDGLIFSKSVKPAEWTEEDILLFHAEDDYKASKISGNTAMSELFGEQKYE